MLDNRKGLRLVAETRLVRYEARVEAALKKALRQREAAVATSLTAAGEFVPDTWPDQVTKELRPALQAILDDVREGIEKKVGARATAGIDTEGQLTRMLGQMETLGPNTAAYLEESLADLTTLAKDAGLGVPSENDTRRAIRKVFQKAEKTAASIARNETAAAVNAFSYESALAIHASGVPLWKTWLATDDARTRPTHVTADGQPRPIDQPYSVGAAEMMFPHDPAGGAAETRNCRCSETYSTEPPEEVKG